MQLSQAFSNVKAMDMPQREDDLALVFAHSHITTCMIHCNDLQP